MPNRLQHIDVGAGIMILWMIIYHALPTSWSFLDSNPYAISEYETINPCVLFPYLNFFMPWFFYKSGQFFEKREQKELLIKDARKLLLTFVLWSAIGYLFYLFFGALQHSLTIRSTTYSIVRGLFLTGKIPINEPLWFLVTLFGVRFLANLVLPNRDDKNGWWKIVTIVIGGYLLAYLYFCWDYRLLPYWVANGTTGLVFFTLGYALRDYEDKWWLFIPCALVYLVCSFIGFPMVDMMFNKLLAGNFLLWMPVSLCSIVAFNKVCRFIAQHLPTSFMAMVGKNAMVIYVTHILIVSTIAFLLRYYKISEAYPYTLWIIICCYGIFLPILCKFIPENIYKFVTRKQHER